VTDWIITLPQTVRWEDYEKELESALWGGAHLNYRVPRPVGVEMNDRIFVVWRGRVRGWMRAVGCAHFAEGFRCMDTGANWPAGYYVQRTGAFHKVDGPEMKGFRGIRRMKAPQGA
jgi:hypothetical protein